MLEIDITLTLRSPLTIGAGAQQGTLAQRGLLKDRDGWPFIPATTLKGRLRHAVEQLVAAVAPTQTVLDPHAGRVRRPQDVVTALFGAPWVPGSIRFPDLPVTGPPPVIAYRRQASRRPTTTVRTSVALNRRRRVAADERLFDTELFWPGVPLEFGGTLHGARTRADAAWLVAGLRLLPALGRSKSAGLGWVTATATVREDGAIVPDAALRQALAEESADE